jgi:hypothetical protein
MRRAFNTTGPCQQDIHYTIAPTRRLQNLRRLVDQRNYFVLHAPRQIGKTTAMLALAQDLTATGQYAAVMVSAEIGAAFNDDPGAAELAILDGWRNDAEAFLPAELWPPPWPTASPGQRIRSALAAWSRAIALPLVLFIDEIDALRDNALLTVLRQLRSGFPSRPHAFPSSLALIGLRDVRDYKIASGGSDRLHTTSPFNIKAESFTMRGFYAEEIAELYQQHTDATGQIFEPGAIALVFELTGGQPWLVNALARQLVEVLAPDPGTPITTALVQQAKEILIRRRDTHIDSLTERLREDRVKAILQPMLAGLPLGNVPSDDIEFIIDLGLCKIDPLGGLVIANPIYREILPRALAITPMAAMPQISPVWLTPSGMLDLEALREAFLAFWLHHGEPLLGSAPYAEIAPHLVMMAFLDRVANGGGTLDREYAIGRDRMDLCLRYGELILGIEIKVWRDRRVDPLKKGLDQLDSYLARLGQDSGWLVIFDQRSTAMAIESRLISTVVQSLGGRSITLIRA